ncbi:MAG: glucose-6-phosphate isomerase [Acidobacteriota bacterium]
MEQEAAGLQAFAAEAAVGAERVLVLGMGGSSLAPLVFADSFPVKPGGPRLEVLDSTDPESVLATARRSPPSRTIYVVSSKSGTTLEPNILFDYFWDQAEKELGGAAGSRFVVITDPGSALEKEAGRRRVRRIFPGDPAIGGRYSALSHFGLVPAAFCGADVSLLLRRARAMEEACRRTGSDNPGLLLGAALGSLALQGRDKLTFDVGAPIPRFGMWIEQLVAESTGKEGRGILPVEGELLGPPESYGSDRVFVAIRQKNDDASAESLSRLAANGHPVIRMDFEDAADLGGQMFLWEFATAVAGRLLDINPFDQPNVQEAKDRTNEILAGEGTAEQVKKEVRPGIDRDALARLLASIGPGDYFAMMAYVQASPENEERLSRPRLRVRDARAVATTVGFGPRFLHSTGQFHKGGPPTGVFLQVTADPADEVPIPGRPFGFGRVLAAQAAGDLAALVSRNRRALRVDLGRDVAGGLAELDRAVGAALAGAVPDGSAEKTGKDKERA